jgi:hypothetical protein
MELISQYRTFETQTFSGIKVVYEPTVYTYFHELINRQFMEYVGDLGVAYEALPSTHKRFKDFRKLYRNREAILRDFSKRRMKYFIYNGEVYLCHFEDGEVTPYRLTQAEVVEHLNEMESSQRREKKGLLSALFQKTKCSSQ